MKSVVFFLLITMVLPLGTVWAQQEVPEAAPADQPAEPTDQPAAAPDKPELTTEPEFPIRGQAATTRLNGVADPTQWQAAFTYRPNSKTSQTTESLAFDATGTLHWKPTDSGIVQINVKGPVEGDKASMNVAVRFPSPPAKGIVILLLAGFILFGGAGWSLAKALKK